MGGLFCLEVVLCKEIISSDRPLAFSLMDILNTSVRKQLSWFRRIPL